MLVLASYYYIYQSVVCSLLSETETQHLDVSASIMLVLASYYYI